MDQLQEKYNEFMEITQINDKFQLKNNFLCKIYDNVNESICDEFIELCKIYKLANQYNMEIIENNGIYGVKCELITETTTNLTEDFIELCFAKNRIKHYQKYYNFISIINDKVIFKYEDLYEEHDIFVNPNYFDNFKDKIKEFEIIKLFKYVNDKYPITLIKSDISDMYDKVIQYIFKFKNVTINFANWTPISENILQHLDNIIKYDILLNNLELKSNIRYLQSSYSSNKPASFDFRFYPKCGCIFGSLNDNKISSECYKKYKHIIDNNDLNEENFMKLINYEQKL